ncbi:isovaleryl-CoA dehydrogenase [Besnoitia besnoiti]|uniref:Isovaleryl-CoA dehydrogenase n=1 Tax=Besnoitia besnoiti TaxID=94643 RepID=A0A2A9MDJ9_BESBE|nr:isovaleryl-CoA dehydrogenase [Besnoitia besnoiti]PFH35949.1 isovaleryl-CoA dehydrogenase [Besnoitia besnoiti]
MLCVILQLQQYVREFSRKEIAPNAARWDKDNSFPKHLLPLMGSCGLLGPTAPTEHGGLGLDFLSHVIIMEEISRASAGIGLSYGAHSNLCINQISRWGTTDQHQRFLPPLLRGHAVGALAMSEPEAGSDVLGMRSQSRPNEDGSYTVRGSKSWITNGTCADVIIVYAKDTTLREGQGGTSTGSGPARKVTAFILEKGMSGLTRGKKLDKLGMRCSETCELYFDDVRVPPENILGSPGDGAKVLMSGLDSERLVLAAGPLGIMAACVDAILPYINSRRQFNQPVADFQLMQGKLADVYCTFISHRAFLYSVARAYSKGDAGRTDCAAVILSCAEKATLMALDAIQMLGGNGYTNEYPVARLLRDSKLYEIGAGTSEIRRLLIARELNSRFRSGILDWDF